MNSKERIKALVEGKEIDRVAISGWYHMPLVDRDVDTFTNATIETTDRNHWDFIKVMTNGHYYTEAYGADITFSTDNTKWYGTVHRYPILSADDLRNFEPLDITNPVFARELEVVKRLKDHYQDTMPIISTIFHPLTAVQECIQSVNPAKLLVYSVEEPEALRHAVDAMMITNKNYLEALFKEGIDGIFLANQYSMGKILTDEAYQSWVVPYEKEILDLTQGKTWFNMIHAHGDEDLRMDDYINEDNSRLQAINWENCPAIDPAHVTTIADVRKKTDKVLIAGIDQYHDMEGDRNVVKDRLIARIKNAIAENGSNRMVFGPGCGLPTGGTANNELIYEVAEEYGR